MKLPNQLVEALRRSPETAAVITDFDGTLSPIVDDPAAAGPLDGAVEILHRLGERYGCVAVVSGRPVSFLRDRLTLDGRPPDGLVVSGLYGLERLVRGTVEVHPEAEPWRAVVEQTADRAEAAAPEGIGVERKGLSLTLHVRTSPELAAWAKSWSDASAATTGLVVHGARMSFELRPPVHVDKGTVVGGLIDGHLFDVSAACFLGDDIGDLPAFDALDRFAAESASATAVRVGVRSAESAIELLERADVLVDGPPGALAFLGSLL